MTMNLDGDEIVIKEISCEAYEVIKSWNLMKWNKSEHALRGTVSLALLNHLASLAKLPQRFESLRIELAERQRRIDEMRSAENPEPLMKPPIKLSMYKHQVRGFNMCLLTFDWV